MNFYTLFVLICLVFISCLDNEEEEEKIVLDNIQKTDHFKNDDSLVYHDLKNILDSLEYGNNNMINDDYIIRLCETTGDDYVPLKIYTIYREEKERLVIVQDVMRLGSVCDSKEVKKIFEHKNLLTSEIKTACIIEISKKQTKINLIPFFLENKENFNLSKLQNLTSKVLIKKENSPKWYYIQIIQKKKVYSIFRCNRYIIEPEILSLIKITKKGKGIPPQKPTD